MHRAVLSVLAAVGATALAACGASSGSAPASASSSGPSSPATATATATTVATTTTVVLRPQPTASDAAGAFVNAWRAGDPAAAATVALATAVQSAFAAGIPSSVQTRGCSSGDFDPASCVYRTDLGEAQVRATKQGGGWIVDQVKVTPA